ncbi:MAG: hypothetical protein WAK57_16010, partial [Desulfobacterales bacterium]
IELIEMDDVIRELFIQKAPLAELKKTAAASGTVFLRNAALAEVLKGETTFKEANRVTFIEPEGCMIES